jgi:hypothetical protein
MRNLSDMSPGDRREKSRGRGEIRKETSESRIGSAGLAGHPGDPRDWVMIGFSIMPTILLLICSNIFMTIAWYRH